MFANAKFWERKSWQTPLFYDIIIVRSITIMQFDEQFLAEMGLSAMPEDQKQKFLDYIQEELEVRIGERISKGLTEVQLNEFDMITDPIEAAKWLEKNRPDYREIVNRTIEEMKDEIRANRSKLI